MFNVLLQVLDDGRLTDGQGRTVDFRNTVIVMTSNLGSDIIQELAGEDKYEAMKNAVMEVVGGHFRPEFINRIDETVVFHPLGREQIRAITGIQIEYLRSGWRTGNWPGGFGSGTGSPRRSRFRSRLRCTAAETGDPAAAGKSTGAGNPGRSF